MDLALYVSQEIASKVLLIGWDDDRRAPDQGAWGIEYYGTAYESREIQLQECIERKRNTCFAHLAVRLPDNNWIVGKVDEIK